MAGLITRREHFDVVGSTNDVVRGWLAEGTPEVCLAVADRQSAGRGREGRTWTAPSGTALLLSLGFRPRWLRPDHAWRLAAVASLAMVDAAESVAGLPSGAIRLKWPNDLVAEGASGGLRKLAGVLGESDGLGSDDPRVVIGIGVNGDWAAAAFPPELAPTMTSLRVLAGGRPIDHAALLDRFLDRLERLVAGLRDGTFPTDRWAASQVTTGRDVGLVAPDGTGATVRAVGVDADSGGLVVADPAAPGGRRAVVVGEIHHVRMAGRAAVEV